MNIGFIVSSRFGQTEKIAKFIAERIVSQQNNVSFEFIDLAELTHFDFTKYQLIIIGASIRYGHFDKKLLCFVNRHATQLNQVKSAFFAINLTARKAGKNTPETNGYTRKFLAKSKWKPTYTAVFAGALEYSRYGFFDKHIIRFIMKLTGGVTDLAQDIEYTDWQKVTQWTDEIISE